MLKRIFIGLLIFAGIIVLAGAVLFIWIRGSAPKTDKEFLSQLKGEIVFTRRNDEGISDIWKINANGTGERLLYHNDKNLFKTDSRNPLWSNDGSKIYFISFDKNKKQQIYEMDADGGNVKLAKNPDRIPLSGSEISREKSIKGLNGNLYITQNNKKIQVFKHSGYYDQDFSYSTGAREASWSPDKKYIIFEVDGFITVADKNGRITKITEGNAPDWKY